LKPVLEKCPMKKTLAVVVLAAVMGTVAFAVPALSINAGADALFNAGFGGGVKSDNEDDDPSATSGFGGFAFLDTTFAELDVAFVYATTREDSGGTTYDIASSGLQFSLLGKYPIELGLVTVFPLLGANYTYVLSRSYDGKEEENFDSVDASVWGFSGGGGLDYELIPNLYLRGEILYNINLPPKEDSDEASGSNGTEKISHGPTVKLAIGYKFF
jgi:opacity protein-like surface antigen